MVVDIKEISSADIEMALRNMNNGKSTGPDNLGPTGRSVEEFGKNWSEFFERSIEQDH